jgi:predicted unusual protein kinase regulating ubiquinone biosynthesis (AarF/ABC1/UbiB family)
MAEDREGHSVFGEVRRMVRTSGAVTGIAARVAGHKLFGLKSEEKHAGDLKAVLGSLKGPMMKIAQFLSTVPDALPPEIAKELATLQANAPPMGWPFVRRRMASELGPNWESKFKSFEREAAAAASLGQVHRAILPDGQRVACKLQYPDMASAVEADLRQLKLAISLYRRMDSALENEEAYIELSERLREELDYLREASQQRLYGIMLRDVPGVRVPVPVEGYCTKRLLTMSWLDGRALQARIDEDPPEEERAAYARALFRAWYVPFYRYAMIHGDPHLGNYQVHTNAPENGGFGINLLDFGVVRVFEPRFVGGVIMLYEAVRDNSLDKAAEAYRIWGFKDLKRETVEVLNIWARFLYEPLTQDRVRLIQESDDPQYGRKVAEEVHAGLKRTGGVRIPREFPLMDRSAIGLGAAFLRLNAKINWHDLFQELIADFDVAKIAERQKAALAEAGVPPTATPG